VWPALVLVAVVALDRSVGRQQTLVTLVVIAPLLASSLTNVRVTIGYGVLAVAIWAALGVVGDRFATSTSRSTELVRLVGIVFGSGVAGWAAVARERREARLRRMERVADVAQRAILPRIPPTIGAVQIAARYESSAEDATVGGDFYAALETGQGVRILVGDVRGSGLEAVRLASATLGAFRERVDEEPDLVDLANRLDASVRRAARPEDFVTAVLVQIAPSGVATIVNAGHLPPILFRRGGARILRSTTIRRPLGLAGSAPAMVEPLQPGDRLLIFTDGATEVRRPHDRAFRGTDAIISDALQATSPEETVARVFAGVLSWGDGRLTDDAAVFCIRYQP
jgi:sigma-B regulation protein RsbU (phosphoserine phosphatase)